MDDTIALSIKHMPISKIIFIGVIALIVIYLLWRWAAPSTVAEPKKKQDQEQDQDQDQEDDPTKMMVEPPSEYEGFMNRLQKGEIEARRRALSLAADEKKSREAEEAARRSKDIERVKTHTLPVGSTVDA